MQCDQDKTGESVKVILERAFCNPFEMYQTNCFLRTHTYHAGFLSVTQLQSALAIVLEHSITFEQSQSVMNNFSKQKPGKAKS